jgi:hypothetical protein
MKATHHFGCPSRGCRTQAEYVEDIRDDRHHTTTHGFTARARVAAASRGWVPISDLPGAGPEGDWPGWLVCAGCARELAGVAGEWTDRGRAVSAPRLPHRLRWMKPWLALGYTVEHGASGHYKVRARGGSYVASVSSSPRDPDAARFETERLLRHYDKNANRVGPEEEKVDD